MRCAQTLLVVIWVGLEVGGLSGLGSQTVSAASRPDLTLPVMPNSSFEGMAEAPVVAVTALSPPPSLSGLEIPDERVSLDGLWRYQPDPDEIGIDAGWAAPELEDSAWMEMPVPSNYVREDQTLAEFYEPVWFRRTVQLPASWVGAPVSLSFDGVDYFAKVWVNGHLLANSGEHEGYFGKFRFDVGAFLQSGDNLIAVMVTNPYDYGQDQKVFPTIYPGLAEKVWIKGIFNYHDLRPGSGLRGAISQSYGTGGIYGPVALERHQAVSTRALFITPDLASDHSSADLLVDLLLENHTQEARQVDLRLEVESLTTAAGGLTWGLRMTLPPGLSRIEASQTLTGPRLWWPWDHPELGNPDLYRLTTTVVDGEILDQHQEDFGVRSVYMEDEGPNAYWIYINGKRLFQRGSNNIPTEWLSEADRSLFEQDVTLMKDANMNAQRVHAHVSPDALYEVADEAGMMVHQDFPLQWEYSICDFLRPNGDPVLTNNADVMKRMLAEMIYQLYNHPSIILWTLHNEPLYIFTTEMNDDVLFPEPGTAAFCRPRPYSEDSPQELMQDFSLNTTLDYQHLYPTAAAIEGSRPVNIASGFGDKHNYLGWYVGTLEEMYDWAPPMTTEYGAQGAPYRGEAFLEEWIGADFWPPDTDALQNAWRFHDAQLANLGMYVGRAQFAYQDYPSWAFATQLYQASVLKYGNEALRRHRFDPTAVAINFTFQNWWDSITWGYVDVDRRPLLAYQWVKTSFSPVASFVVTPTNIFEVNSTTALPITVVNDYLESQGVVTLRWRLVEETDSFYLRGDPSALEDNGESLEPPTYGGAPVDALTITVGHRIPIQVMLEGQTNFELQANIALTPATVTLPTLTSLPDDRHFTLYTELLDAQGNSLHSNFYHYVVVDSVQEVFRRTEPGIHPTPRFDLDITLDGAVGASVRVVRLFGEEEVFDGAVDASELALTELKPGIYEVTATTNGQQQSEEVFLNENIELELEF